MKNLKMILVLVFCYGLVQISFGQPDTLWTKKLDFYAMSVDTVGKDNFIMTHSNMLHELNSEGEIINEVRLNLPENYDNLIWRSPANGYILEVIPPYRIYPSTSGFFRLNDNLDSLWYINNQLYCYGLLLPLDNGQFIASSSYGTTRNYDEGGNIVWETEVDCSVQSVTSILNDKFVILNQSDFDLLIFSNSGDSIGEIDLSLENSDESFVVPTDDTEFLFIYHQDDDLSIYKYNHSGDIIWSKNLYYSGYISNLTKTVDGGFIMIGGDRYDAIFFNKFNREGEILWEKVIEFNEDLGWDRRIYETSDKGYLAISGGGLFGIHSTLLRFEPDTITIPVSDIYQDDFYSPRNYSLSQNYPNPFNPSTTIEFTLPKSEFTTLTVFNILGKEVTTLVSSNLNQGNHTFQFDGKNLASGIYYYQLMAGEYVDVKKMLLIK